MPDKHFNALVDHIQLDSLNRSRRPQPMQLSVQLHIFHGTSPLLTLRKRTTDPQKCLKDPGKDDLAPE